MTQTRGFGLPTKRERPRRPAWTLGRFHARSGRLAVILPYPIDQRVAASLPCEEGSLASSSQAQRSGTISDSSTTSGLLTIRSWPSCSLAAIRVRGRGSCSNWWTELEPEYKGHVNDPDALIAAHHDGGPSASRLQDPLRMWNVQPGSVCQDQSERPERRGVDCFVEALGSHQSRSSSFSSHSSTATPAQHVL